MAKSVLELAVGTGQWDAGLKKAKSALDNFTQANGGLQQALDKESQKMQKFVQMMGGMESTAKTAKGQMNDYKSTIEQLTMQYNRMTEAQKKVIGQDYLQAIEQMKQKYQSVNEEIQEMNRSLNNVKLPDMKDGGGGLFSGMGDKMSGALQVFAGNMLTKAAGAVANLGSEMMDMVQQGVELAKQGEGIRIAFERLGRGDILDGLRQATHGTVTDLELMKAAVKFNDFKLPLDELGTMLAFAQQKAKDTGQSVDYMVDSIVTGLGRKSLMILDNLGLSATEIKDKMAETGDMTKAVGAIIREQMSKAGDYVETAADRAAQANVSLQNKMEELGRKFAPVEEASSQLWTSMKIGILDVIGGPLTDLLNKLTQAGRMASQYGIMGGNAKVGRMTSNLAGASEGNRQSIYQQQQQQFWKYINPREQQLKDIRAWQRGDRNEALQKRIGAITEKYGSLDATKIQAEVDAAKKMLSDYQSAAKQILSPVKAVIDTSGAGQSIESLKGKLAELEAQRKKAIAAGDTDLSKNLAKQITQVKSDIKGLGGSTTVKTQKNLPEYTDFNKQLFKSMSGGGDDLKQEIPHFSVFETFKDQAKFDPENILGSKDAWEAYKDTITGSIGSIGESMNNLSFDGFQESYEKVGKDVDKLTKSAKQQQMAFGMAGQAADNLGAALAGMDDPAARAAGTVISAIANIALGFGQAVATAGSMGPYAWLAYVAAGTAALATTISTVHSLTGYAQGGIVKGNSYSGDNIYGGPDAMVNAGELVLTKAQQGNLASQLQEGGMRNMNLSGRIRGTDIILSVDRTLSLEGKQLLTWGR